MGVAGAVLEADPRVQQRLDALTKANGVRAERAALKKRIKAGRADSAQVLTNVPAYAETMRVFDLLMAHPYIGRVKANRICRMLNIRPSIYLHKLSKVTRDQLIDYIAQRGQRS